VSDHDERIDAIPRAGSISLAIRTITALEGALIWSEESTGASERGGERRGKEKREPRGRGRIVLVTIGVRNIIIPGDSCVALA